LRRVVTCLQIIVLFVAAPIHAQQPAVNSSTSASIEPPNGERMLFEVQAEGVQTYSCVVENGKPGWKFLGPEAKLTTLTGETAGSHSSGPTWKLADGSEVKGSMAASKPAPEEGSIPWLLVRVVSRAGVGKLSSAEYVTRTNTKGGVAPQTGCDDRHLGTSRRVPYSAIYRFYGK
jgi:hypothetical protein